MAEVTEHEPLLGRIGEAAQAEGQPIHHNLILGTGIVAQFGVWILAAVVWSGILSNPLNLFSAHPLLNSAGLVLAVQAALILQPTHTAEQKKLGTYIHAVLVDLAALCFLTAFIIIEVNKAKFHPVHFQSPHAILGLITYIFTLIQAIVGVTQFFFPNLYGSEERAKSIYKYHRASGYGIFALLAATICAATWTDYNIAVLGIHHWAAIVSSLIFLLGLYARVKKQKLGFSA